MLSNAQIQVEAMTVEAPQAVSINRFVLGSAFHPQDSSFKAHTEGFNNFLAGDFVVIKSIYILTSEGRLFKNGKERKKTFTDKGTFVVNIDNKRYALATLVAKHFVPNPDGHRNIGFENRDNTDCRAENLYWMGNKEYRKYCGLHKCDNPKPGRKKIQGDRLTAITTCECYLLREYYITLNDEWLKESFETAWMQVKFKNRQKVKMICYEYFWDRVKRFSLIYHPVKLIMLYRRTALNVWRKENNYDNNWVQFNENVWRDREFAKIKR